jgi:hypothetical protein
MSLVLLGGKERTLTEFTGLLAGVGYRLDQVIPIPTEFSILGSGPPPPPPLPLRHERHPQPAALLRPAVCDVYWHDSSIARGFSPSRILATRSYG